MNSTCLWHLALLGVVAQETRAVEKKVAFCTHPNFMIGIEIYVLL